MSNAGEKSSDLQTAAVNSTFDIENAVELLTSGYSIIDFGGEVRYLKNSNVSNLLTGDINPLTTRLNLYRKMDIELFQQRDLENSQFSVKQSDFRNIIDAWRLASNTKCFQGTDFDSNNTDPDILNLWRGPIRGQEGDWEVIRSFLLEIIANRNIEKYEYLLNFLAHAIQKPGEKPGRKPNRKRIIIDSDEDDDDETDEEDEDDEISLGDRDSDEE